MSESYYVGVYWGPRRESLDACAERLAALLAALAQASDELAHWFRFRPPTGGVSEDVTPDVTVARSVLLDGRSRTDVGDRIMEELGSRIDLFNIPTEHGDFVPGPKMAHVSLGCGLYAPRVGGNCCLLDLPSQGRRAGRLATTDVVVHLLERLADIWEADWGVATSHAFDRLVGFPEDGAPRMGWLVYLSRERGAIPPLPPFARLHPVASRGAIIAVTEGPISAANPQHAERAAEVGNILRRAGLLGPLR